uniref:Glucosidase 2 subunit beta n=2 Tax=Haemonchus contortus TaxID=6289 RepID=A0A7I4Y8V0_HAECO
MRSLGILFLGSFAIYSFASDSDEVDIEELPRGVPYHRAALYKRSFEFMCLDGSKSIPYDSVNDDYCDCDDGSDEPGTSACPDMKFHCANKGHIPKDIPSSRVDDTICDCCDGSDEFLSKVECPNICDELGQKTREESKKQAEIARKGFAARKVLAMEGQKLRDEKVQAAAPLKEEREKLLPTREELLKKKNTAVERETALKDKHKEAWEATKQAKRKDKSNMAFNEIDLNKDQKITLDELKKLPFLDTDNDGAVSDEEAKIHMNVDEADAEYFLNNMYDLLRLKKKNAQDPTRNKSQEDEHDDLVADEDKEDKEETKVGKSGEAVAWTDEEGDYVMPSYDEETQKAMEEAEAARKEYDELDVKISTLDSQIQEAEWFINQDFGSDLAWATLKGQCYELNDTKYIYKYCPFDKTVQKDINGYGETGLGNWNDWSGEPEHKYSKQAYTGGQQCWNGPQRSTQVVIECGETSELIGATEPSKCEYRFLFRTPAACTDPDHEEQPHMEL